jgi:hypothetical protein
MKKTFYLIAIAGMFTATSCGGNADADAFCDCYSQAMQGEETDVCEEKMEQLEDAFKDDEARYEAFAKAARATCPDAEKYIKRMD